MKSGTSLPTQRFVRFVPPDLRAIGIPRLAGEIARRAVVQHAAIHRPGPGPVGINAQARRIVGAAALHQRARFGPGAAKKPVAAGRGAVVAQQREAGQLLARFDGDLFGGRIGDVGDRAAVQLFGDFGQRRIVGIRVVPGQIQNRIRELAALLLIQLAHLQENARQNFLIELGVARRRNRRPLPLQPARRIDEGAVFFGESRAGQAIHLGLDVLHLLRRDAGRLPEAAGLVGIDFADHQPVGFLQRVDVLLRIRPDGNAVHAERDQAFHLAAIHVVPDVRPGIFAIHFGQIIVGPIVFLRGGIAVHGLQERNREFRRVRPIIQRFPLLGLGRGGRDALHPAVEILIVRMSEL